MNRRKAACCSKCNTRKRQIAQVKDAVTVARTWQQQSELPVDGHSNCSDDLHGDVPQDQPQSCGLHKRERLPKKGRGERGNRKSSHVSSQMLNGCSTDI